MQTRLIGNSGLRASVVGLGCNNFGVYKDAAMANAVVGRALDVGITFFDMAGEHGAGMEEELFAAALGNHRKEVVIATKFGQAELLGLDHGAVVMSEDRSRMGMSRRWIAQAVEDSLRRLNTDYIDLFQPHVLDATTPAEETMRALDDLVLQGKVRAIGQAVAFTTANDVIAADDVAIAKGLTRFVSVQAQYNLLVRDIEAELLPCLRGRDMSLLPYFPLANGMLTGKYRANVPIPTGSRLDNINFMRDMHFTSRNLEIVERLRSFAENRGLSLAELAISWLLAEPLVASVIAGATNAEQVSQNAAAAGKSLSSDDLSELRELTAPR